MNPIHQCIQKISPGNHFSYVQDVRTYVRTRVILYAPPPPITNGRGITMGQAVQCCNRVNLVLVQPDCSALQ